MSGQSGHELSQAFELRDVDPIDEMKAKAKSSW